MAAGLSDHVSESKFELSMQVFDSFYTFHRYISQVVPPEVDVVLNNCSEKIEAEMIKGLIG